MSKLFKLRFRLVALVVLGLVLVAATYGFAAANTVPDSSAGDGTGNVSGYTIANIVYTVDKTASPAEIDAVAFDLTSPSPGTGSTDPQTDISLDGGTTWISCTVSSMSATCTLATPVDITTVTSLRVVTYDN